MWWQILNAVFRRRNKGCESAINHCPWKALLAHAENNCSGLDEPYFRRFPVQRANFRGYIESLQMLESRNFAAIEQQVYWINLHNALALEGHFSALNDAYNLQQQGLDRHKRVYTHVQRNVRRVSSMARHYMLRAIEDSAMGLCGDLRVHCLLWSSTQRRLPRFYTIYTINAALHSSAKHFINSRAAVRIESHQIRINRIYQSYVEKFGVSEYGILDHLEDYARPLLKIAIRRAKRNNFDVCYDYVNV
ncbi:MAG: hypothetical protein ACI93R_002596 [Flavobacteriales bacterium]|jgi:hypothetical protein